MTAADVELLLQARGVRNPKPVDRSPSGDEAEATVVAQLAQSSRSD